MVERGVREVFVCVFWFLGGDCFPFVYFKIFYFDIYFIRGFQSRQILLPRGHLYARDHHE